MAQKSDEVRTLAVAAFGNGFYFTEKLFLTLPVHSDSASTFFQSVETVAEELLA